MALKLPDSLPTFIPLVILRDSHPDDAEYMEQMKQLPGPKSCYELLLKVKYYITLW
jgi:hypothetical protein